MHVDIVYHAHSTKSLWFVKSLCTFEMDSSEIGFVSFFSSSSFSKSEKKNKIVFMGKNHREKE